MKDILEEIVANKRQEVAIQKQTLTYACLEDLVCQYMSQPHSRRYMSKSLKNSASGIIAEFKRRSPSKGWIKEDGRAQDILPAYARMGASALSILTDSKYFGGHIDDVRQVRPLVPDIPILRKDFIIDPYQLLQARLIGADAVLLIAADLTQAECRHLAHHAHELELETLLEIHSAHELDYVNDDIDMVGVNNRNLGTFHTDVENSFRLACLLPKSYVLVSESGISNPNTVQELRQAGFRGFLIGETFMKTDQPGKALADFIAAI